MSRRALLLLAAAGVGTGAAGLVVSGASAQSSARVRPEKRIVDGGDRYVLKGTGWSLLKTCEPQVSVTDRGQKLVVGRATIRKNRTFRFSRVIPSNVEPGTALNFNVTQICRKGKRRVPTTRSVRIFAGPNAQSAVVRRF